MTKTKPEVAPIILISTVLSITIKIFHDQFKRYHTFTKYRIEMEIGEDNGLFCTSYVTDIEAFEFISDKLKDGFVLVQDLHQDYNMLCQRFNTEFKA
jgi:hypothetical protein